MVTQVSDHVYALQMKRSVSCAGGACLDALVRAVNLWDTFVNVGDML